MPVWDPERYLQFAAERGRPFADLIGRVGASDPRSVVDLGCGPGNLTATLADHWPGARVLGIDCSERMIAAAQARGDDRLHFEVGDVRTWAPEEEVDVLVTNATLQWVPDHLPLLARWLRGLASGGWLALQVPGNVGSPSHRAMAELSTTQPYADALASRGAEVERLASPEPAEYVDALVTVAADLPGGLEVDVWETTYHHLLPGPDPVLAWLSGTGARPVVQALEAVDPTLARDWLDALAVRLREAHPPGPGGTALPFRRIFAVAHRGVAG